MLAAILKAIPIGLILSITPGAALFSILQVSISRGFKCGFSLAVGISISDILLVALCFFGLASIMQDNPTAQLVMGLVGGVIIIIYGGVTFLNKKSDLNPKRRKLKLDTEVVAKSKFDEYGKFILQGFIFNFTNPFVWILWLGLVPFSGTAPKEQLFFLLAILITIFAMDTIKSFFANKIKNILTPEIIYLINRIMGLILSVLGIVLIIRTIYLIV